MGPDASTRTSQQPEALDAVVLAGGINTRELYAGYQPGYKALVELDGKPLIRYVLDALEGSRSVRRIGIVGSEKDLRPVVGPDYPMAPAGEQMLGSLVGALSMFPESPRIVLATADLTMLRSELVDDYVALAARQQSAYRESLFLSVVPRDAFTGPFARCGKNFNVFRDVAVCHGNLHVASPRLLESEKVKQRVNAIYAGRKSPITSALAFGLGLGLAYVLGVHFLHILTLKRIAGMASKRFGFGIVPVLYPHPEVAVDIDEAGDFDIAREVMGTHSIGA